MGPTLLMAYEKNAYALSDDGTYYDFSLGKKIDLPVMVQGDKILFNSTGSSWSIPRKSRPQNTRMPRYLRTG